MAWYIDESTVIFLAGGSVVMGTIMMTWLLSIRLPEGASQPWTLRLLIAYKHLYMIIVLFYAAIS